MNAGARRLLRVEDLDSGLEGERLTISWKEESGDDFAVAGWVESISVPDDDDPSEIITLVSRDEGVLVYWELDINVLENEQYLAIVHHHKEEFTSAEINKIWE